MSYVAIGIAILAGMLLAANWFVNTHPKTIIKIIKWSLFGIIISVVIFFLASGRAGWALAALPAVLPYLMRIRALARAAKNYSRMQGPKANEVSKVKTQLLQMYLEHETGKMYGHVIAGSFKGRQVAEMNLSELRSLLDECQEVDSEGARIIINLLNREYPSWQEEDQSAASEEHHKRNLDIDRDEAFKILGLSKEATKAEIKVAYQKLIANVHPDHGGSSYLAAQINRAKDILLNKK